MANKNAKPKNPRTRAIVSLVAILVVVAVCGYVALFGDLVSQTFVPSGDFAFSLTLNVDVGCV